MLNSLKASISFIADILRVNPYALHERQRALVKRGLLESKPGYGPGSGTPFTPETVAVLLISMLATDSVKESAEPTRALSDARLKSVSIGKDYELGNPSTFKAAMVNVLSSDAMVNKITFLRVHRRSSTVEIFTADDQADQAWEEPPAGKIFSRAEIIAAELDHEKDHLHFFEPKKGRAGIFEGMRVVVELRGGAPVGYGGGSPTLGKIRALLRANELAAAEVSTRKQTTPKSKSKVKS